MRLIELYSNSLSIDKQNPPILPSKFFPVPADKYITIQNSSGMGAKDYDLYQEVINLIEPYLTKNNISILQIGAGEIKPLNRTTSIVGQTSFAQTNYVLMGALLHLGNDSFACHTAYTVPVVSLYGSTSVSAHSPYFAHSKSKFLESHRFGKNPSFQAQEGPKTINLIKPELVAKTVLDILEIPHEINQNTIFLGDGYAQGTEIHVLPDQILNPNSIVAGVLNLRADLFFDLNGIIGNIQMRQYALWLNRELDIDILRQLKPNISAVVYEVQDDTNPDYLQKIIQLGIILQLWTKLSPEEHNKIKIAFLDLPIVHRRDNVTMQSVKEVIKRYNNQDLKDEELGQVFFSSRKHYLSRNKIYNSLYSWKRQINVEHVEDVGAGDLNDQDFRNEISSFLIWNKQ